MTSPASIELQARKVEAAVVPLEVAFAKGLDTATLTQWNAWDSAWRRAYANQFTGLTVLDILELPNRQKALDNYEAELVDWQKLAASKGLLKGPLNTPSSTADDATRKFWKTMAIAGAVIVGSGITAYLVHEAVTVVRAIRA